MRTVTITETQWRAIEAHRRALGAFVAHFDGRWLPPVVNALRWDCIDTAAAVIRTFGEEPDADQ